MLLSRGVAPRVGAPLAKMTRVWRVETRSDGVGADLLGVQQLLQVARMYSLAISVKELSRRQPWYFST